MRDTARRHDGIAALLTLAAVLIVYAPILVSLVRQWSTDDNYSHGFVVLPCALYFAWLERSRLARLDRRPALAGLAGLAGAMILFALGELGAELFLTRLSLVAVVVSAIVWLWGWRHLRLLVFPLGLLLLTIPLPALVFNQLAFPLQLVASRVGESLLSLAGIPVLRDGNVLVLPSRTLEVAQACSGIRSLVSLLAVALIIGRLQGAGRIPRTVLAVVTVPLAIAANGVRVAITGAVAEWISPAAAEGILHEFTGWMIFAVSVFLLVMLERRLGRSRGAPLPARVQLEALP